jgi:hypothetical protein
LCFGTSGALGASSCFRGCGFGASGALRRISAAVGATDFTGSGAGIGTSVDLDATGSGVGLAGAAGLAAIAAKLIGAGTEGERAVGCATATGADGADDAALAGAAVASATGDALAAGGVEDTGLSTFTSCFVFGLTILIALLATFVGGVEGVDDDGGFIPGGFTYAGIPIGGIPIIIPG